LCDDERLIRDNQSSLGDIIREESKLPSENVEVHHSTLHVKGLAKLPLIVAVVGRSNERPTLMIAVTAPFSA
jgi:hypothetical protein